MAHYPDPGTEHWLPLKPVVFHILLALAEHDSHAYGIIQSVRERSSGRLHLETGPLYRHLTKMLDGGLIEESANRPADIDPRRGSYYALTKLGRNVLYAESQRLDRLIAYTKELGVIPKGGKA
jgi:DNA-binding PadR family transcriptional regulator